MTLTKLAVLGVFLLLPLHSHATVAGDIASGLAADQVIANALADGLTISQIADQIAQEVGSSSIGLFRAAFARTVATATDTDFGDTTLQTVINAAIGTANANNYPGRGAGAAYVVNSARFAPVAAASIRGTTGILALSSITVVVSGRNGGRSGAPPGGGGGGSSLGREAACEGRGSEPGCLE